MPAETTLALTGWRNITVGSQPIFTYALGKR